MRTTVNNTSEAVDVLFSQLQDKDFYLHNYKLLSNIEDFLSKDEDLDMTDDDEVREQIFNYLAYDLKWEYREDELFPMEL